MNATELQEFPQNDNNDRPHGHPEPYHGEETFGRSTSTEPFDLKTISMAESWDWAQEPTRLGEGTPQS